MPCLEVKVNVDIDKKGGEFIESITEQLAKVLGKSKQYLMISLTRGQIAMGGDLSTPTAFVTLRYLGPLSTINDDTDQLAINKQISQCVATNLKTYFNVDGNRYFLVINEEKRINWGKDGDIPFYKAPQQKKQQQEEKKQEKEEDKKTAYKIPNALQSFSQIIPNKNNLLLFLDYDGTLSEIVSDPDNAILTDSMNKLLIKLAKYTNITIIIVTGRSIKKVKSFINENNDIHFAGNHGIEIEFAVNDKNNKDGKQQKLFVDEESVKLLESAYNELKDEYKVTEKYNGVKIEYKQYSLSLHYRNIQVNDEEKAIKELGEIMKTLSDKYKIHLSVGKKLFELKCVNDWNKGMAIKWMLENRRDIFCKLGDKDKEENNVIFIGDDVTDEDGFGALLDYDKDDKINDNVSCILVTHNKVRETKAGYYVNTVKDVEGLLGKIGDAMK